MCYTADVYYSTCGHWSAHPQVIHACAAAKTRSQRAAARFGKMYGYHELENSPAVVGASVPAAASAGGSSLAAIAVSSLPTALAKLPSPGRRSATFLLSPSGPKDLPSLSNCSASLTLVLNPEEGSDPGSDSDSDPFPTDSFYDPDTPTRPSFSSSSSFSSTISLSSGGPSLSSSFSSVASTSSSSSSLASASPLLSRASKAKQKRPVLFFPITACSLSPHLGSETEPKRVCPTCAQLRSRAPDRDPAALLRCLAITVPQPRIATGAESRAGPVTPVPLTAFANSGTSHAAANRGAHSVGLDGTGIRAGGAVGTNTTTSAAPPLSGITALPPQIGFIPPPSPLSSPEYPDDDDNNDCPKAYWQNAGRIRDPLLDRSSAAAATSPSTDRYRGHTPKWTLQSSRPALERKPTPAEVMQKQAWLEDQMREIRRGWQRQKQEEEQSRKQRAENGGE